jgi:hypothetical protein
VKIFVPPSNFAASLGVSPDLALFREPLGRKLSYCRPPRRFHYGLVTASQRDCCWRIPDVDAQLKLMIGSAAVGPAAAQVISVNRVKGRY